MEQLNQIKEYLVDNRPLTFSECVQWARLKFELEFNNEIRQLLHSLPKDLVCWYSDCSVVLLYSLCLPFAPDHQRGRTVLVRP